MSKVYATPGVYIEEKSAFPNSAVPVATAVPAFLGYTEKAIRNKKSLTNVPTRISSFGEYLLYFGGGPKTMYKIDKAEDPAQIFQLKVTEGTRFLLYYSMKLFFANGGSDCYIVSVGDYSKAPDKADFAGENGVSGIATLLKEPEPTMVVIPEAVLLDIQSCADLQVLMLKHCRDMASRFSILDVRMDENSPFRPNTREIVADFRTKIGTEALQWGAAYYPFLNTTITGAEEVDFTNIDGNTNDDLIGILLADVDEAKKEGLLDEKRAANITAEVEQIKGLNVAVMSEDDAADALKNIKDEDGPLAKQGATLADALAKANAKRKAARDAKAKAIASRIAAVADPTDANNTTAKTDEGTAAQAETDAQAAEKAYADIAPKTDDIKTLHQTLLAISPLYKSIMESLRAKLNLLPPSAGMAGIYSMIDHQIGVFQSPANVSIGSVVKPWVNLTTEDQDDLNIPLNGKAVNAIRTFPGKGVLVWGARTLDGNSQDWRYVSVRRTVIFIEQSVKYACGPYVFAPNTSGTWTNVKAMITNFLTNVWQSGALAGSTPAEAFSVDVGLGSTMTPVDILDGYMRVTVKIAVTRPAEFIVITFQQKMQES